MDRIDDEPDREWLLIRCLSATAQRRMHLRQMHTFDLDALIESLNNDEIPNLDPSQDENRRNRIAVKKGGGCTKVIYGTHPKGKFLYKGREVYSLIWIHKDAVTAYKKAKYIQLDCSFRATKPFAYCVPQVIIDNEAVPVGFFLTLTESTFTYQTFMEELWSMIPANELVKLPILSDQGLGLIAFCALNGIRHYFCHRQLIAKWGASSAGGMLAARVLKLVTLDEYLALRVQFIAEAEALCRRRRMTRKQLTAFKKWLQLPTDPNAPIFPDGIWHRAPHGIARCSNHAERFHGIVNQAIKREKVTALPARLKILQIEILRRVAKYEESPRERLREVYFELMRKKKCQVEVCHSVDCHHYREMMADRCGFHSFEEFPCPHTIVDFMKHAPAAPKLETLVDPAARAYFAQFPVPLVMELSDCPRHELAPDLAAQLEGQTQVLNLPTPKKGLTATWDDDIAPPDHFDQLNPARQGHSDQWLAARAVVSGVFSTRLRAKRCPQDYDKLRTATQIVSLFDAAYANFETSDSEKLAHQIAKFSLPWYEWAKTNKNRPCEEAIGPAPEPDAVPILDDEISYHFDSE
jgi:hypothetical protein